MRMYQTYDLEHPEVPAFWAFHHTLEEAEKTIDACKRYTGTEEHPGHEYMGIKMVERASQPCKTCGSETQNTAENYPAYPYCRMCHYTGQAADDEHEAELAVFRAAFPEADVSVEHTGGGCFWLAFHWPNDHLFYVATDEHDFAEMGVVLEEVPVWDGGPGLSTQQVIDAIRADRSGIRKEVIA